MLDLNVFSKEVHENAHAHGWWEQDRSKGEILALIHSEISEALEEYRAARPMVWYECKEMHNRCDCIPDCYTKKVGEDPKPCEYRNPKPEGIAVELIDCCIRILDFQGAASVEITSGANVDGLIKTTPDSLLALCEEKDFPEMIAILHALVSEALVLNDLEAAIKPLLSAQAVIYAWVKRNGLDPEKLLIEKHEYNKSRPYKHGNKVC